MSKPYTMADVAECDSVEELAMLIGDDALEVMKRAVIKAEKDRGYHKAHYLKEQEKRIAIRKELAARGIDVKKLLAEALSAKE